MKRRNSIAIIIVLLIIGVVVLASRLDWQKSEDRLAQLEESYALEQARLRALELEATSEVIDPIIERVSENLDEEEPLESRPANLISDDAASIESTEQEVAVGSTSEVEANDEGAESSVVENVTQVSGVATTTETVEVKEESSEPTTGSEQPSDQESLITKPEVDDGEHVVLVANEWVQGQIDENIDSISDADLMTGLDIYEKLDTDYLFAMAEEGVSEEEEAEISAYLDTVLSPGEKKIALELYRKYVHLLN